MARETDAAAAMRRGMDDSAEPSAGQAIRRWLAVTGSAKRSEIVNGIAPVFGAEPVRQAIEDILMRRDAVALSADGVTWFVPVAPHHVVLGTHTVDVGCIRPDDGCREQRLVDELGPPTFTVFASSLEALVLDQNWTADANEQAGLDDLSGWRALALRAERADLLAWPSHGPAAPTQLARAAALFGHLVGVERQDALAELAAWAGLDRTSDGDSSQAAVARYPAGARLLVEAGPGSGKTHTIAARVMALAEADVSPARIQVVSFTRNAVAETLARLARAGIAEDVDCSTVDQLAGRLVARFGTGSSSSGYDETVKAALGLLRSGEPRALEWLVRREHFVVDEAQDVVGVRRDFILALVDQLDAKCGVTVACDPYQAIYGHRGEGETLAERCRAAGFAAATLARNHRAGAMRLREFAAEGRQVLETADAATVLGRMDDLLRATADGIPTIPQSRGARRFADLLLFRTGNAMAAFASRLAAEGIPFALRGGRDGTAEPPLGPAWIGAVAGTLENRGEAALESALSPLAALDPATPSTEEARDMLAPALSKGLYSEVRIASALAGGRLGILPPRPGTLILSTVHAAKGLEADRVAVFLPQRNGNDDGRDDPFEEARILYVAGTRARMRLEVGPENQPWRRIGGRHVRRFGRAIAVQLSAADSAGISLLPGSDPVRMAASPPTMPIRLRRDEGRWTVEATFGAEPEPIATLAPAFAQDVRRAIAEAAGDAAYAGRTASFSGTLRMATIGRDEGVACVPVLEGFARVPIIEASR